MIGILYESDEWSDYKLKRELEALGHQLVLIDATQECIDADVLKCKLLVSRVFASALQRYHEQAHDNMLRVITLAREREIMLINPEEAHYCEINKHYATERLATSGLDTPCTYALGLPGALALDSSSFIYPCIIKPNCGGRSTHTAILRSQTEAETFLSEAPTIPFVVQEYIEPERGYVIRAEVVAGKAAYVYQRSVGTDGLSSYHAGSEYKRVTDPSEALLEVISRAAQTLEFELGSFDIIESHGRYYFIDANSVTNVSEDCTESLGVDLMKEHALYISNRYEALLHT